MSKITLTENHLLIQMRDETMKIEPYGENIIRVRSSRNARLSDESWTVLPPRKSGFKICGDENCAELTSGCLTAKVYKIWGGFSLEFYRDGKKILQTSGEGDRVMNYVHTEGDNYKTRVIFNSTDGERFYGLGQEQQDFLDRKGGSYSLLHYNTKSTVPFVYSSLGYGFFWNNPSPGTVELSNNRTVWTSDSCYQADYFVIGGENPKSVTQSFSFLTGTAPVMPDWALGFWQCKLRYESQEDLLSVAREYKRRRVPIDAIVIDYFHWTEQGNWEFEPSLWPDPKAMCDELLDMGIKPIVSIWPTINPNSRNYHPMNDQNMLVRTENGQYGIFDFYGQQTFIDPTNPQTREYVWDRIKETYYSYGIKSFWLDEAEPEVHPQQFNNLKFYLGNGAQTAMLYPYYYAKTFYDGLKKEGIDDVVLLIRAAWAGSQKFGTVTWNGDIPSTFDALRQSVISGLSMAMCGIVWWNSDIGGFHQGDVESDYFRELIVRWFQFGLFCPVMRLHGARKRMKNQIDRHPGVKEPSGGDNEIWSFGERNYPILKNIIELRERMKPYIKLCSEKSHETGEGIMRPMFFDFPDDDICYSLSDQYMFGPDILFAPILSEGQTERKVYLPKGSWIRTIDKKEYEGGTFITCQAQIDEFIAFVKKGSDVINIF